MMICKEVLNYISSSKEKQIIKRFRLNFCLNHFPRKLFHEKKTNNFLIEKNSKKSDSNFVSFHIVHHHYERKRRKRRKRKKKGKYSSCRHHHHNNPLSSNQQVTHTRRDGQGILLHSLPEAKRSPV